MLQSKVTSGEDSPDFKWGVQKAVGRTNKNVHFYESFTSDGIEYRLFDHAYFIVPGQGETSIGQIVKMFETSTGEKKIKVFWFFRPIDIRNFLGRYEPQWDELFLACGDDVGVYNINYADTIMGKCNVLCVSDDRRNPQPTRNQLRNADYVFSRTFDTRLKIISEYFTDAIAGIKVENFFNKRRDEQPLKRLKSSAATSSRASPVKSFSSDSLSTKLGNNGYRDGKLTNGTSPVKKDLCLKDETCHFRVKKNPPVNTDIASRGLQTKNPPVNTDIASRGLQTKNPPVNNGIASDSSPKPCGKRKFVFSTSETDDSDSEPGDLRLVKNPPLEDRAPTQNINKSSWYKKLPFDDELKPAIETDRLLLIENLEPSYTSPEVEDLCWQAFKEQVDAKMIPASLLSSPHNGKALVIFSTTKAADKAMTLLNQGCLMMFPEQRPLVGSRKIPEELGVSRSFTGHISLMDKALMSIQKRNAVSTSHCAQPNNVEHQMALEWRALQAKSKLQWKRLYEEQAKEINIIRSKNTRG